MVTRQLSGSEQQAFDRLHEALQGIAAAEDALGAVCEMDDGEYLRAAIEKLHEARLMFWSEYARLGRKAAVLHSEDVEA